MTARKKDEITCCGAIGALLMGFGLIIFSVGFVVFMKHITPPTQSSIREKEALKLLERIVRVVESRSDSCSLIDGIFD